MFTYGKYFYQTHNKPPDLSDIRAILSGILNTSQLLKQINSKKSKEKVEDSSNACEIIIEEEEEQVEIESDYSNLNSVEHELTQPEDQIDFIHLSGNDYSNSEEQEEEDQINNTNQNLQSIDIFNDEELYLHNYDDFEMNVSFNEEEE